MLSQKIKSSVLILILRSVESSKVMLVSIFDVKTLLTVESDVPPVYMSPRTLKVRVPVSVLVADFFTTNPNPAVGNSPSKILHSKVIP